MVSDDLAAANFEREMCEREHKIARLVRVISGEGSSRARLQALVRLLGMLDEVIDGDGFWIEQMRRCVDAESEFGGGR